MITSTIKFPDQIPVQIHRPNDQEDKISKLDMMKKLMEMLNFLQEMEKMLTNSTTEDIEQISKLNQALINFAETNKEALHKNLVKSLSAIEKQHRQNIFHKIFGGLVSGLLIIAGTVMCCVGNAEGALLIGMGILSAIQTAIPKAFDTAVNFLSGHNPAVEIIFKSTLIITATAAAAAFFGPAAAIMTFATTFSALNPIESCASMWYMNHEGMDKTAAKDAADNNTKLQMAIGIVDTALMIIAVICSLGLAERSSDAPDGKSFKPDTCKNGEIDLSPDSPSIDSSSTDTINTIDNQTVINRIRKFLKQYQVLFKRIHSVANISLFTAQTADSVVDVSKAITFFNIADITKEIAELHANGIIQDQMQNLISEITKLDSDFLQNLQKNYQQSSQSYINKLFIDQVNFAAMLADIA